MQLCKSTGLTEVQYELLKTAYIANPVRSEPYLCRWSYSTVAAHAHPERERGADAGGAASARISVFKRLVDLNAIYHRSTTRPSHITHNLFLHLFALAFVSLD